MWGWWGFLEIYKQKSHSQVFFLIKCAKYKPPLPRGSVYFWYSPSLRDKRSTHTHTHTITHTSHRDRQRQTCTQTQAHTINIGGNWRRNTRFHC